jgi:CubicO group peptidase (beta-lactamase class C family)
MLRRLSAVFAAALVLSGCGGSGRQPPLSGITSVLVMKHGRIVREDYFGDLKANDRVPVFSVTKSVTSALVGIAIARGDLSGLDQRLPWRKKITLRQLLSMTAGYAPSFNFQYIDPQSIAARALVNRPGTFGYDSGSIDLAADMLEGATGMSLADYANRHLFGRLGIRDVRWPGSHGASGLLLRPRELLAFGELYLEGGRKVVPADWVRVSTRAHVRIRRGLGYGYGWWVRPHSYAAYGYLGQVLAIYPKRDEVVLVTASREDAKARELVRRIAGE